jgi:NAD(P)-dependent dehydrogenase (short-subunit alcohol dehydrogenase family)
MTSPIERDDSSIAPEVPQRNATVAVVGAGDYIGAAIARRFARGGYTLFGGRMHGDKLAPLVSQIEAGGGVCIGRALDARQEGIDSLPRLRLRHRSRSPSSISAPM